MINPEEHIAQLIFLHLQGVADVAQEKELSEWRQLSPANEELFQRLTSHSHWETSISRFVKPKEESSREWSLLQQQIRKSRILKRNKWFAYAAMLVCLLSAGSIFFSPYKEAGDRQGKPSVTQNILPLPGPHAILILPDGSKLDLKDQAMRNVLAETNRGISVGEEALSYRNVSLQDTLETYHTLKIPRGGEYRLTLSDSTVVYLNADSRLIYPVAFKGKERRVFLSGEAYFEVKKSSIHPFIVETGKVTTRVMGTTFGIRAYEEENNILTTLESGSVTVSAMGQTIPLLPNRQAVFDKATSSLEVKKVDISLFLAWKDGRLKYDNCPLEKIMSDLSRWYGFEVFFNKSNVCSYQFSIDMKKYNSFEDILQFIEKTEEVRFEIKGKTVIVK